MWSAQERAFSNVGWTKPWCIPCSQQLIPSVKHPDNIPSQHQPWSLLLWEKGTYLIAACTLGGTRLLLCSAGSPLSYAHVKPISTTVGTPAVFLGTTELSSISRSLPFWQHGAPCHLQPSSFCQQRAHNTVQRDQRVGNPAVQSHLPLISGGHATKITESSHWGLCFIFLLSQLMPWIVN